MSKTIYLNSFDKLGPAMRELGQVAAPMLVAEFHHGLHESLREETEGITPVGATGVLKNSIGSVFGQSTASRLLPARFTRTQGLRTSYVVLSAPHAIVIGKGLAVQVSGARKGRRLGSPQAPRGIPEPAIEALSGKVTEIFAAAERAMEAQIDGR